MFGKTHRFHGYNALRGVYARGQTARGGLISLKYARRDAQRPYRVGVVVSRKVSKSAVVRNRLRRRVYAAVRLSEALIAPGSDLVFTVYSQQLAELPADKLQQAIAELLQKTTP